VSVQPVRSNWGRWGAEDERGAANLVTPAKVLEALGTPRSGRTYNLAQQIRRSGVPMSRDGGPPLHFMAVDGGDYAAGAKPQFGAAAAEDYLVLRVHGVGTHLDSLGHVWADGQLYNGFSSDTIRSTGMRRCGIDKVGPLVTRGILLDVAALLGVRHLDGGYEITPDDLERATERAGVEIRPGDAVLIRTGWLLMFADDASAYHRSRPGIGPAAAQWMAARDVTLVGADNAGLEVVPYQPETFAPVHQILLRDHGIYIMELLDLEELAADGVPEFCLLCAPLRVRGGTGSPLTPVAIA
jgi:kynurenine formamidase